MVEIAAVVVEDSAAPLLKKGGTIPLFIVFRGRRRGGRNFEECEMFEKNI